VEDEIAIELEKGKTLSVRMPWPVPSRMKWHGDRVFFELNGQPRTIKVPDRSHGATGFGARRKAEADNPPMWPRLCQVSSRPSRSLQATGGEGRRPAAGHRGDEDGNRHPRRA
jgi:hypothetical protein